ncbi:helix-turn-helix domain-containing protein [Ochrobactrum sp. EDr1-4]|uniref:helix-turn-helix domain-containing protein n=1 Tax=Ochrobactrum sp. EDr1-4 TaxID=3368622 RepID=UPI003B9FBA10
MNEAPLDIPAIRKALNLTQSQLAGMAGVNLSTVWRWENDGIPKRGPARALLDRLNVEAFSSKVSPASSSAGDVAGASVAPPAQSGAPANVLSSQSTKGNCETGARLRAETALRSAFISNSPEVLPSGEAVARCEVRQRATATNSGEAVR